MFGKGDLGLKASFDATLQTLFECFKIVHSYRLWNSKNI